MILIKNTISIEAKLEAVFHFLADPEKLPNWNYYIQKVYKTSPGNDALGSRFRQIRKNDEQIFEITKFHKNQLIEFTTISNSSVKFKRLLTFTELNERCVIEDNFELDTGHPIFLQRLLRHKIKKGIKENLMNLKQLLETGQAILQDGRVSSLDHNISDY